MEEFYNEIYTVYTRMERWGGSFEKGLAQALMHADICNALRIKCAFGDLWDKWLNWKENKI